MRRNSGHADRLGVLSKHLPDDLLSETIAGDVLATSHWAEYVSVGNSSGRGPRVDRDLHPIRHRRRTNPPVLSDEIDNAPATVALLNVCDCEGRDFGPAQSATE